MHRRRVENSKIVASTENNRYMVIFNRLNIAIMIFFLVLRIRGSVSNKIITPYFP